jgi:hypothetical protein
MVTLYHGSTVLFDRPSNAKLKAGFANSEHGYGFNTSDYGGDAWEHCGATFGVPGIIYKYEFDETRLENWLVSGKPIGQDMYERIVANIDRVPSLLNKEAILKKLSPDSNGQDVFGILQGREKDGVEFMKKCGIEGSLQGNYYVFFDANAVPPQKIDSIYGDFPQAKAALEEQKRTGHLVVDQPVKADGTIVGPRRNYKSEDLSMAAWSVHSTGNTALIAAFEKMVDPLLSDEEFKNPGGHGFSYRQNLGIAVNRALKDGGVCLNDHWSGANTFARTLDSIKHDTGREDLVAHAKAMHEEIKRHASRPA